MPDSAPRQSPGRDDRPSDGGAPPTAPKREPLWRHMLDDQLRRLRHDRGETLGDTARRAAVSPQYLSEIERGIKDPSSEMIAAVAGALDVTLIDLSLAVAERLIVWQGDTAHGRASQSAFVLAA